MAASLCGAGHIRPPTIVTPPTPPPVKQPVVVCPMHRELHPSMPPRPPLPLVPERLTATHVTYPDPPSKVRAISPDATTKGRSTAINVACPEPPRRCVSYRPSRFRRCVRDEPGPRRHRRSRRRCQVCRNRRRSCNARRHRRSRRRSSLRADVGHALGLTARKVGSPPSEHRALRVNPTGSLPNRPCPRSSTQWPPAWASNPAHRSTNNHRRPGATAPPTAGEDQTSVASTRACGLSFNSNRLHTSSGPPMQASAND